MHRTGRYKMINITFGFFPFVAAVFLTMMKEGSGPIQSWLSIVRVTLVSYSEPQLPVTDSSWIW
jgi:hypothetical protein